MCPDPIFVIGSPPVRHHRAGAVAEPTSGLRVGKESYTPPRAVRRQRSRSRCGTGRCSAVNPCWLAHERVEQRRVPRVHRARAATRCSRAGPRASAGSTRPRSTRRWRDLAAMFPGAVFLHIVRDGRHVVPLDDQLRAQVRSPEAIRPRDAEGDPGLVEGLRQGCETWATWVDGRPRLRRRAPRPAASRVRNEDAGGGPGGGLRSDPRVPRRRHRSGTGNFFGKQRINSSWVQARPPARATTTGPAGTVDASARSSSRSPATRWGGRATATEGPEGVGAWLDVPRGMRPRVFCIGLNKTGTSSFHEADDDPGAREPPLGGTHRSPRGRGRAGRGQPAPVGPRPDDRRLLRRRAPHQELRRCSTSQYPGSRFVLTVRPLDAWVDSRRRHVERNMARQRRR